MGLSVYLDRHTEIQKPSEDVLAYIIIKSENDGMPNRVVSLEGIMSVCQPIAKMRNAFMVDEWFTQNVRPDYYHLEQVHDIQFATLMTLKERCERALAHKDEIPLLFPCEVPYESDEAKIAEIAEIYSVLVKEEIYVRNFVSDSHNRNMSVKYTYTGGW